MLDLSLVDNPPAPTDKLGEWCRGVGNCDPDVTIATLIGPHKTFGMGLAEMVEFAVRKGAGLGGLFVVPLKSNKPCIMAKFFSKGFERPSVSIHGIMRADGKTTETHGKHVVFYIVDHDLKPWHGDII